MGDPQCRDPESSEDGTYSDGESDGEPGSTAESPDLDVLSDDQPLVPATVAVDNSREEARTLLFYIFCNWLDVLEEAMRQREIDVAQEEAAVNPQGSAPRALGPPEDLATAPNDGLTSTGQSSSSPTEATVEYI